MKCFNKILWASHMEAILFALALEVGLLQMRVLEGSIDLRAPQLRARTKNDSLKLEKLLRDRKMATEVMRRSLVEVAETGGWTTLQQAMDVLMQKTSSSLSKQLHHEQLKITRDETARTLESKRNQWALDLRNADQKVAFLRDKLKDDLLNANTRLYFAEKWLSARAESLELQCQEPRAPAPRVDYENRVHAELVKTFELQIKQHKEATEYWRLRFADDTAKMNLQLADKRQQLEVVVARHEELQQLFNLHEGEMRAWLSFKQQRAERLARQERSRLSAIRIQAWWRGLMVRKALGPFRFLRTVKKSPSKSKKK